MHKKISIVFSLLLVTLVSACTTPQGIKTEAKYPTGHDRAATGDDNIYGDRKTIFGSGGIFSTKKEDKSSDEGDLSVNSFLWKASLDTVSFMPLASADPFGGVILTDWYTPKESPNTRYKLNVFITSKELRSDAVSVKVFEQESQGSGWVDTTPSKETGRKIEDAILTRARQLRVEKLGPVE